MKLVIASDKSGFTLKEHIKAHLQSKNIQIDDIGTQNIDEPKPYFEVASCVAKKIQDKTYDRAILICGTGAGVSIVANKFKGVSCVACEGVYSAKKCRAINDANILAMGGWIIAPEMGVDMVEAFLNTEFLQGLEDFRQTFLKNAKIEVAKIEESL